MDQSKIKVSIIMPVYNAQEYVGKAASSVLQQEFDSFELIAVDDGSKDESLQRLQQLAKQYDNLRVIHQENGGICVARNTGLAVARGEYVGFCDNDDEYLPNLLKDNYQLAIEQNADLVRYGRIKYEITEDGKVAWDQTKSEELILDKHDYPKYYDKVRGIHTIWTGLYRRSIIEENQLRFDESFKNGGEDSLFNLHFLQYCNKIAVNAKAYYMWMHRDAHSTSKKFHLQFLKDYHKCMELEYDYLCSLPKEELDQEKVFWTIGNYYVSFIINYLSIPSSQLSIRQKVQILKMYRKHPIYSELFRDGTLQHMRKYPIVGGMTWLFYHRAFYLELVLYAILKKISNIGKYKKAEVQRERME